MFVTTATAYSSLAPKVAHHQAKPAGPAHYTYSLCPCSFSTDTDVENQKEAIISILEDWAAWERTLEQQEQEKAKEGAEKTAGAGLITDTDADQQPLVEVIPSAPDPATASLKADDNIGSRPHTHDIDTGPKNNAVVAESINESVPTGTSEPTPKRTAVSSDACSAGASNQLLYASRRERRRAERNDPVARARRQALKVWAADQTRRRSSVTEASGSESLQRQGAGSLKEWAVMNSRISRRSSTDATVDHNRKGAEISSENAWFRRKKLPPHVFAPRQVSVQRDIRNVVELGLEPRQSPRLAAAAEQPKQRLKNSHPWRANMTPKAPRAPGGRPALSIAREGEARTAPSTPRSPAPAALSSSPSSPSMVGGRGSPWARSPSRETAGGILVNHCFFYGSSGKATAPKAVAATANPSFESKWMRQFREEVSSNPNWWLGSDRFVLGRVAASNPRNVHGGGKGSSGRPSSRRTQALTTRGNGRSRCRADRTTDLWQEVRSLLAAGRHGGATNALGGEQGRKNGGNGAASTPGSVDMLSFGDRLRYTPLSQGAWLVGRAAAAAASEQESESGGLRSEEGSLTIATVAVEGVAAAGVELEAKDKGKKETGVDEAVSGQVTAGDQNALGEARGGKSDVSSKTSDGGKRRSSRQDLQSVHAATLAKLRGEIDLFTREELVLRAAEEARGALARERARSTSPRRASAGIFPPSSQRKRGGNVPDSIDYDKVEATLSLIELATRAAGPDAGKQMLQALEGLDKMHQRVSEEKGTADEEGRRFDGEQASASRQEARFVALADKRSARKGSGTAAGVSSATAGSAPATADGEEIPDAAAQDEAGAASPRRLSRKLSLAVSSSSEESSADSEASSVGIIQTIGNWLWSNTNTPPTLSRRNSQSSYTHGQEAADENKRGHKIGRGEFPAPPEGSDASDCLETNGEVIRTVSDDSDEQGELDVPVEGRARTSSSSAKVCGKPEKPSRLFDPAAKASGIEGSTSDNTPNEQRSNKCQTEERTRDVSTGMTRGKESALDMQAAQGHNPDRLPGVKTRRRSEADKPSGSPQLAKDIARAEESIWDAVDLSRKDFRDCDEGDKYSSREAPASCTGSTGGKEQSASEASRSSESNASATVVPNEDITATLPDVAASDAERKSVTTDRGDSTYGDDAAGHGDPPMPTSLSQAGFEPEQGGDPAYQNREHTETDTETETQEEGVLQDRVVGTTEKGKPEKLGRREADTTKEEEPAEGKGGLRYEGLDTGSPTDPLSHRDSWVSVGTRPRRGKIVVQKQASVSEISAADAQSSVGGGEVSSPAATGVVAGKGSVANGTRDSNRHKGSPTGRYAPFFGVLTSGHSSMARACLCSPTTEGVWSDIFPTHSFGVQYRAHDFPLPNYMSGCPWHVLSHVSEANEPEGTGTGTGRGTRLHLRAHHSSHRRNTHSPHVT